MARFVGKLDTRANLPHILWALLCVCLCAWLIVEGDSGHPPAIILLPVVLVIWCAGHFILWGVRWLAAKGRASLLGSDGVTSSWPPELIVMLFVSGAVGLGGLFQLAGFIVPGGFTLFGKGHWGLSLAVSFAHSVCFVALLLRRPASLLVCALICAGWATLLLRQYLEQIVNGHRISLTEYAVGFVGISLLVVLVLRILYSRRIRAFMGQ